MTHYRSLRAAVCARSSRRAFLRVATVLALAAALLCATSGGAAGAIFDICYTSAGKPGVLPPSVGGYRVYTTSPNRIYAGENKQVSYPDNTAATMEASPWRFICIEYDSEVDTQTVALPTSGDAMPCMTRYVSGVPNRGKRSYRYVDGSSTAPTNYLYNEAVSDTEDKQFEEWCGGSATLAEFLSQPGCFFSSGSCPNLYLSNVWYVGGVEAVDVASDNLHMEVFGGSPVPMDYEVADAFQFRTCCSTTGTRPNCNDYGTIALGASCGTGNLGVCELSGCKCASNSPYTRRHCTRGCGDGIVEPDEGEECDPGLFGEYTTRCSSSCKYRFPGRQMVTFHSFSIATGELTVRFAGSEFPSAGFDRPHSLYVAIEDQNGGGSVSQYPKSVILSSASDQYVVLTGTFRPGVDYRVRVLVRSFLNPGVTNFNGDTVLADTFFSTGCGCDSSLYGTPELFTVRQSGDSIFFSWIDRASCESRFNVYRKLSSASGEPTFFTTFTFKGAAMCNALFAPTITPDLVSELSLGTSYTYFIEAQAQAPAREYTSPRAQANLVVQLVSSLVVRVLTTTGGPVAGATVSLVLASTGASLAPSVTMDKSGSTTFEFTTGTASTSTVDVRVLISHVEGAVTHSFTCAGVPCTSTVSTTTHLGVTSVVFVDTSLVDITGKLTFAGTSTYTAGAGACALVDPAVKVCAYATSDNRELDCSSLSTESATRGQYSLAVPVYTAVVVRPTWVAKAASDTRVHVFSPAARTISITSSDVSNANFEDVTTSTVTATVVASACALYMGPSRLTMRIPSCGAYERTLDAGTSFKGQRDTVFALPAVPIEITFRDIHPSFPALSFPPTSISPLNVPVYLTGVDQALVALALDTVVSGAARWEYHVPTTLALNSLGVLYECNPATPIRVVKQDANLLGRILLVEDYGDAGQCANLTGSVRLYDEVSDAVKSSCSTRKRPGFCDLPVGLDVRGNALAQFSVLVGTPNVVTPFLNYIRIEYKLNDALALSTLSVAFLTEGDRGRGEPFTLRLPPNAPTLVLHDPPGDGSCASFSSEEANSYELTLSEAFAGSTAISVGVTSGFETESTTCAGAPTNLACVATSEVKNSVEVSSTHTWGVSQTVDGTLGVTETTSATYTTSCDEGGTPPGKRSDMVLAPVVTVKFELTDTIRWNPTICSGVKNTTVKWLPVANRANVASFQSYHDIDEYVLPELERVRLLIPPSDVIMELVIRVSILGWKRIIEYLDAGTGFDRAVSNTTNSIGVDVSEPKLLFTGGGAVLERAASSTKSRAFTTSIEMMLSAEAALKVNTATKVGTVAVGTTDSFAVSLEVSVGASTSSSTERTTSTSFALSDNDVGDFFEFAIARDEAFGTPVFNPIGGSSMCPYEGRPYVQRETFDFVARTASLVEDLPADGSALFSFEVQNLAPYEEELALTLSLDPGSNPDALAVFYQATVLTDRTFSAAYGEPFTVLLEAKRGPLAWLYDELAVTVSSSCDGAIAHTLTLSAHFLQPCSSVSWAGDLALAGSWIVNGAADNVFPDMLRGYAKNPQYSETRWAKHTRTRAVSLEYRPDGALLWRSARDVNSAAITLTATEDPFGFALFEWDLASLPDGVYDLRVVARCEPSPMGGEFDESAAPVLRGLVDRSRPELFGFPEPVDGVFFPGDSVSFTFDAGLRCALPYVFATTVLVDGVDVSTDVPVKCEGDTISLALGRRGAPIETLGGATVAVSLTGVQDVAGNVGNNVAYEFVVFDFAGETADALVNPVVVRVSYDAFVLAAQAYTDAFVGALEAALAARLGDQYDVESQLTGRLGLVGVESTVDGLTKFGIYVSAGVAPTAGALADTLVVLLGELTETAAALRPPSPSVPEPDTIDLAPRSHDAPSASAGRARANETGARLSFSRRVQRARAEPDVAPADIMLALDDNAELVPAVEAIPSVEDSIAAIRQSSSAQSAKIGASYAGASSSSAQPPRVAVTQRGFAVSTTLVSALVAVLAGIALLVLALATLGLLYRRLVIQGRPFRRSASVVE